MRTSQFLMEILGSSERFAQYVLSGERRPGGEKALRLARRLGVPLEAVLFPQEHGLDLEARLSALMKQEHTARRTGRGARQTDCGQSSGLRREQGRPGRPRVRAVKSVRAAGGYAGGSAGRRMAEGGAERSGTSCGLDVGMADRGRYGGGSGFGSEPGQGLSRYSLHSANATSAGDGAPFYEDAGQPCAAWHSPYPGEAWPCEGWGGGWEEGLDIERQIGWKDGQQDALHAERASGWESGGQGSRQDGRQTERQSGELCGGQDVGNVERDCGTERGLSQSRDCRTERGWNRGGDSGKDSGRNQGGDCGRLSQRDEACGIAATQDEEGGSGYARS